MKTLLSFLIMLISFSVVAQKSDSTTTHSKIIDSRYTENFTELNSRKGIKNGTAEVLFNKKIIATGLYKDNERFGRWLFYKLSDTLYQVYNYTAKKVEYNHPDENTSFIVDSAREGDKVIYPIKIGGLENIVAYIFPKLAIPSEIKLKLNECDLYLIFKVDSSGRLTKLEGKYTAVNFEATKEIKLRNLRLEDLSFVPAVLNGTPVSSSIILKHTLKFTRSDK